jgi:hypothetical protein
MTYLIASLEASGLDTGLLVGDDADSGGVHVTEDILDFTDEDLVFSVNLSSKEWDLGLVDEGNNLVFTNVGEVSNFLDVRGRSLVESTTESSTATASASTEASSSTSVATTAETTSAASVASASASLHSYFIYYIIMIIFTINLIISLLFKYLLSLLSQSTANYVFISIGFV